MWPFNRKKEKEKLPTRNGRKYRLALLFSLLLLACFGLASMNPILIKVFAEVVGGIVGIFLAYCSLNVANKAVLGKFQGAKVEGSIRLGSSLTTEDSKEHQRGVVG